MTAVLVFVCQFLYVALLGLQSRNVQHGNYIGAAIVSTLLGTAGLTITTILARTAVIEGGWSVWVAFVLSGPLGVTSAMWAHDKFRSKP